MKGLFISGGSTKFIALLSAVKELNEQDFRPDILAGVSSGAIVSLVYACDVMKEAINIGLNLSMDTIFSQCPFTSKGKITGSAIWNIIRGKTYLGKMGNLEKAIRSIVTKEKFESYQNNPEAPHVIVLAVNASNKTRKIWYLKQCKYELAIKAVMASSSIPLVCTPVEIDGQFYYDGGLRDHTPGNYVLERTKLGSMLTKVVTVFSRPEQLDDVPNNSWNRDILTVFNDLVMPTMNYEISKNDHFQEERLCVERKIMYRPVFIERFVEHLYDVNNERMKLGYRLGKKAVEKYYGFATN